MTLSAHDVLRFSAGPTTYEQIIVGAWPTSGGSVPIALFYFVGYRLGLPNGLLFPPLRRWELAPQNGRPVTDAIVANVINRHREEIAPALKEKIEEHRAHRRTHWWYHQTSRVLEELCVTYLGGKPS